MRKKKEEKANFKSIITFVGPYWKKGVVPVFFLFISTIISFSYPLFSKWAVDDVVINKNISRLPMLAIFFLVLVSLQQLFSYLNSVTFFKFQKNSILDIQVKLLRKIFYYPMEFFDSNHSGYMTGRIRGDVAGLSYIFSDALVRTVMDIVKFFGVLFILLGMNVKLTLITISVVPFLLIKILHSKPGIRSMNEKILEENAKLTKALSDTFQGIEVLKSFSREEEGIKRTETGLKSFQEVEVERNEIMARYRNIVEFIVRCGEVLLLYFGIREVTTGGLTIGSYMAFGGYLLILYAPIRNIGNMNILLDYARRSYQRIKDLLDILPENNGEIELEKIEKIEGKNLFFSYNGSGAIFRDLGFSVQKGDKVLLEGCSGSGKSTLLKLLLGLYRPKQGQIEYNGIPLPHIDIGKLRQRVGYISQNIFFFNTTIRDNILLDNNGHKKTGIVNPGKDNQGVSDERLWKLLEQCRLDQRVRSFAGGLYEEISEKGNNFSGGERQRFALVRALVKNPDIIILDEGTSNLDSKTEKEILEMIEAQFERKIIIRVTHRPVMAPGWKRIRISNS